MKPHINYSNLLVDFIYTLCKFFRSTMALCKKCKKIQKILSYPTFLHNKHQKPSKILQGATPVPETLEIIKIPRRRNLFSRTESDRQGHVPYGMHRTLGRLHSTSALRNLSDGDLFILQSQTILSI